MVDSQEEYEGGENECLINEDYDRRTSHRPHSQPLDRFYGVYWIFFLLGVGSLLPWSFFSNAKQYFMYKLRDTSINDSHSWMNSSFYTKDQKMFENYLELAAQIPCVLFVFINMMMTKIVSSRIRIISSICLMLALFTVTLIITRIDTDSWQNSFLVLSLMTVVLMNAGSAILQGAICGLAGMFPKTYIQGVFSGMGFGGLMASLANLATTSLGSSPVNSGFAFFMVAEIVLIGCLLGYLILSFMTFSKFYMANEAYVIAASNLTNVWNDDVVVSRSSNCCDTFTLLYAVARKIWVPALSVFIVFMASLTCYPAVMSSIESFSLNEVWAKIYFTPVTCFVLFNLMDFIGRNLAGIIQWPQDASPVFLISCLLRLLFIPFFLLCNIQPRQHQAFIFFRNDVAPIILSLLFGLTNGYMGTLSMMHSPRLVGEEEFEMAGSMMAFCLSAGLGAGALLSILFVYIM